MTLDSGTLQELSSLANKIKSFVFGQISSHNNSNSAHSDIRSSIPSDVNDLTDNDDIIYGDLENKYDSNGRALREVAFTGSYSDLTNKPIIPSKTSDLTNDSGFLISHQDISGQLNSAISSHNNSNTAHSDIRNSIPTATSQLTNDSDFVTSHPYITDEKDLVKGWRPQLNGETGAKIHYSYTESNGEGVGKGFLLNNGFYNTDNWTLKFDFKHDNIRYTGINFLADLENSTPSSGNRLGSWEGSWNGGSAYANAYSGTVGWFDVTVKKIDNTHVQLISETLNRNTTVEVSWLANARYLTCGANHNSSNSSFGPCRIKNVEVTHGLSFVDRVYPIGAIYMSVNDTSPATLFGGTWEKIENAFLYGSGTKSLGATGGEENHTLSINEIPSHTHKNHRWNIIVSSGGNSGVYAPSVGSNKVLGVMKDDADKTRSSEPTGGGGAHNNMPPYVVVNIWKRTA